MSDDAKRSFVGKLAQQAMHLACNQTEWQAVAADKLLFHSVIVGAGLPLPELMAVVHRSRTVPGVPALATADDVARFLRGRANYPLFAKPVDGKYSLAVMSADRIEATSDTITLRGSPGQSSVDGAARALAAGETGFLIQRRLDPASEIADAFGDRLWSIRLLVLLTPDGPLIHRATAKVPTGRNPADNYWRRGNLLGALDTDTGRIARAVSGWAEALTVIDAHPDTGARLVGTSIPRWRDVVGLVSTAAALLPGIGTQSWDIAVTDHGPVILEVNFGGDLNLSQIASGRGALDSTYRSHLERHGYTRIRG